MNFIQKIFGKVLDQIQQDFGEQLKVRFDIYKDKYWQLMDWFRG